MTSVRGKSEMDLKTSPRYEINQLLWELDASYTEYGTTFGQPRSIRKILYAIFSEGTSCSLQRVIFATGMSKQTIHSALHKMEADGYLYFEALDAKSKLVCLTERGVQLAQETAGRMMKTEQMAFEDWSKEDLENLMALLRKYITSFQAAVNKNI